MATMDKVDNHAPFHFLVSLSKQLTSHPNIELSSIKWVAMDAGHDIDVHSEKSHDVDGVEASNQRYAAFVRGHVGLGAGGHIEAMTQFRSFVASVRKSSREFALPADVTIIDLPFGDIDSGIRDSTRVRGAFTLELNSSRAEPSAEKGAVERAVKRAAKSAEKRAKP